jgi:hypothetical protein
MADVDFGYVGGAPGKMNLLRKKERSDDRRLVEDKKALIQTAD